MWGKRQLPSAIKCLLKTDGKARHWWLPPEILATWEAEIRRNDV
jgi:hypothetical protein